MPMMFVTGVMGKFVAVLPVAIIATLGISLLESVIILPGHLSHRVTIFDVLVGMLLFPFQFLYVAFKALNRGAKQGLSWFVERVYLPVLRFGLKHPAIILSGAAAILIFSVGFVRSGLIPFIIFPKTDTRELEARILFPDGTSEEKTDVETLRIANAIRAVNHKLQSEGHTSVIKLVHRRVGSQSAAGFRGSAGASGSHVGMVTVELVDPEDRTITSDEIIKRWRKETGPIVGKVSLTFGARQMGPGGTPIEFKILANSRHFGELQELKEVVKARLRKYPGVFDVDDDSRAGKPELRIKLTERAKSLGITEEELIADLRGAYFGVEVDRLQRGRHEVKLMVRYPPEDRQTWRSIEDRTFIKDGAAYDYSELIEEGLGQGYSEINRINQQRCRPTA